MGRTTFPNLSVYTTIVVVAGAHYNEPCLCLRVIRDIPYNYGRMYTTLRTGMLRTLFVV